MQRTRPGPEAAAPISIRLLEDRPDLERAIDLLGSIWGEDPEPIVSMGIMQAFAHFGDPVIGAFSGKELCGVSIGFLAASSPAGAGGIHLHSHITGVAPELQHLGIGFGLKLAQRDWCIEHGIDEVTWTFDPLLARNAHFNIRKLGACSWRLLPDFYGEMVDDLNRGDLSDRLEVHWAVTSDRVRDAIDGVLAVGPVEQTIEIPRDYHSLRATDPTEARRWRLDVRARLLDAFADGLVIVDFDRGGYRLAPDMARNASSS